MFCHVCVRESFLQYSLRLVFLFVLVLKQLYSLWVEIDYVIHLNFGFEIDVLGIVGERQEIGSDYDFDYGLVVVHVLEVSAIVPHQWEDHYWT